MTTTTKPMSRVNAAATAAATSELQSSLRELHIGEKGPTPDITRPKLATSSIPKKTKKRSPAVVADSWEDEANDDSASEQGQDQELDQELSGQTSPNTLPLSPTVGEGPLDPPPTPISPQTSQPWVSSSSAYMSVGPPTSSRDQDRRPEKQTAVAGRLIAGALGMRAPKRTEEQRAYDRATKEQEIRRRNREREEAARLKEEEEKVKAAVWDA
ncbi:hypothetical protein BDW59DRAFT_126147 [Aspergillus cavernicola]|uniref:Uncharacterized protein n=1 Tax=Aspergillus cavernicola TaxID=176166 RepID=A0ABR4HW85_9EURO